MPTPLFSLTKGQLIRQLAFMMGDNLATGDATADSATASTLVDSELVDADDSRMLGAWCAIVRGTGLGQARRISAFAAGSDQITVTPNWATTPGTDSEYYISRQWSPYQHEQSIRQAQRLGVYTNYRELVDRTIILGSGLQNGTFDQNSGGATADPDGWSSSGAGIAIAYSTTIRRNGRQAVRMSGSTATGQLRQVVSAAPYRGLTVPLRAWAYTRGAANDATLRITARDSNGTTVGTAVTDEPAATGWEYLTAELAVPVRAADLAVDLLHRANANEIYWSSSWLDVGSKAGQTHILDADQSVLYLASDLPLSDHAVGEDSDFGADRFTRSIPMTAWRTIRQTPRLLQLDVDGYAGHMLRLPGWAYHADLTAYGTAWTGNPEALLWRAAEVLWTMKGDLAKAAVFGAKADRYDERFRAETLRGYVNLEVN